MGLNVIPKYDKLALLDNHCIGWMRWVNKNAKGYLQERYFCNGDKDD